MILIHLGEIFKKKDSHFLIEYRIDFHLDGYITSHEKHRYFVAIYTVGLEIFYCNTIFCSLLYDATQVQVVRTFHLTTPSQNLNYVTLNTCNIISNENEIRYHLIKNQLL